MSAENKIRYETTGQYIGSNLISYIVMFGFIIFLSCWIIALVIPNIGSHWIYLTGIILSVALGFWSFNKDNVSIRIFNTDLHNENRIEISGNGRSITGVFDPKKIDNWYYFEKMRMKHGGQTLVFYFAIFHLKDGSTIKFRNMMGGKGSEPTHWEERNYTIPEEEGLYIAWKLNEMVDMLQGKA